MMAAFKSLGPLALGLALVVSVWGQSDSKREPGAAREIGAGAGAIGTGAAKGAGSVAKGTAKGAVDLVTLHPINAGASIGKGAATAGKDVTVGTVKGTGKITKGVGRAFKHLF
jgi:hypothetical protein